MADGRSAPPGYAPGHDHIFLGEGHLRNERRVWMAIALTAAAMGIEIAAGTIYGSMALVADGWHMSTHAGALLIAALAYGYARRHARDSRFAFGTGKLGDLAGFASAVVLALVALLIGWQSLLRLADPVPIGFGQAMGVAVAGLAVNLLCAWLLRGDHHHDHGHDHGHAHDTNLRAAYMHVLADALTSVLAIGALFLGWAYGWLWADPLMGIVGALVIGRWSWGLIREAGGILLDAPPQGEALRTQIRAALSGERITDLHVWQLGPGHFGAIVAILAEVPAAPSRYKARLAHIGALSHVTVEVERGAAPAA